MESMGRRTFLTGAAALSLAAVSAARSTAQNNTLGVAVIGCGAQGMALLERLLALPGVKVVAVCDVAAGALAAARAKAGEVAAEADLRKILERRDVDAVVIATPNHWHALAAIWACQAGKDVFLETPACWSYAEGEALLAVARRTERIVAVHHQARADAALRESVARAWAGQVGPLYMARGICYQQRPSIGQPADTAPPAGLDWRLWCGPAGERPYNPAYADGGWHWFWDFGGGEMGNLAVHQIDVSRWFLRQQLPVSLFSSGGRYLKEKDKAETPNVQHTTYTFADGLPIVMEVRGRPTNSEMGITVGNLVFGSIGYMGSADGYKPHIGYKGDGKPAETGTLPAVGGAGDPDMLANFAAAVRSRKRDDLNCELEEGVRSAQLACLANISYRLLRALDFDPVKRQFKGDAEATALLARRTEAKGFELPTA